MKAKRGKNFFKIQKRKKNNNDNDNKITAQKIGISLVNI